MPAQAEGGLESETQEKDQSSVNKHSVSNNQWGQGAQRILCEAKKKNLKGVYSMYGLGKLEGHP